MKNKILLFAVVASTVILLNSCKSSNSVNANAAVGTSIYFPNGDGSSYKYDVQSSNSTGSATGTRSTTYSGTSVIGGVTFQKELDTLAYSIGVHAAVSYFKVSDLGVDYFLDTTGLSASIPDSLIKYLSFSSTLKAFQFPFQSGQTWDVFDMALKIGVLSVPVINVTASYLGTQPLTLTLNGTQSTYTAAQVNYVLTLTIPNTSNPLATPTKTTYSAQAWLVQNIGIVKWQGSGAVFSAFSGNGVSLGDTTTTVTQTLVSYSLK